MKTNKALQAKNLEILAKKGIVEEHIISNTPKMLTFLEPLGNDDYDSNNHFFLELKSMNNVVKSEMLTLFKNHLTAMTENSREPMKCYMTPSVMKDLLRDEGWRNYSALFKGFNLETTLKWLGTVGFESYTVVGLNNQRENGMTYTNCGYRVYLKGGAK